MTTPYEDPDFAARIARAIAVDDEADAAYRAHKNAARRELYAASAEYRARACAAARARMEDPEARARKRAYDHERRMRPEVRERENEARRIRMMDPDYRDRRNAAQRAARARKKASTE